MKAAARAPGPQNSQDPGADNWMGRIGDVIRSERTTPIMFITGLAFAFLLGALHARSPGHGKTVMAAYLVGERGTVGNACLLGLIVTITHTWSVLLLGVVTLYVREHISEEVFSFWLGIISGIIIVVIGMILFLKRYAAYVLARSQAVKKTGESATASHEGRHDHHHGVRKGDGDPLSYWSILGLGISGGIVPCPSALLVLLLAIRLGRLGYGLWLILAFSAGLAVVLIAIGIIAVKASHLIQKYAGGSGTLRLLSVVSSALIVALGFWIVVWTLFQHRVVILFPGG
jgi:ABC-type nickel/cobalt efflux system permease component RcnA